MPPSQIEAVAADLERLAADGFCADPKALIRASLALLTPPEQVSTVECAAGNRKVRNAEGTSSRSYDPSLTPYMKGPQDALDDPSVRMVVVVGPARTGKSVGGENFLFKRLWHGPLTDTLIYLPGASDVDSYADKEFADLFSPELHPEIASKVGKRPTDNKRTKKRVNGRVIELLPANPNTVRQRQAAYIWASEIDGYRKTLRTNFAELVAIRGRVFGNLRKGYLESHPDAGWSGGIAAAWKESSKGLFYWPCPHADCGGWSSPAPMAEWRTLLNYERKKGDSLDQALVRAADSARLICPHCGQPIVEEHKASMLELGVWVFDGQTIDVNGTVNGTPTPNERAGFWIHGTMSPFVSWGQLAKEHLGAVVFFENTGKSDRLREITVKSLGEVFEGGDDANKGLDARKLKQRLKEDETGYAMGTVPKGVRFLTAAVDAQGNRFEVLIVGWDEQGQAWLIDRYAIMENAKGRALSPGLRQEDCEVLRDQVFESVYPLVDKPGWGLPIASMAVDTGGVPGWTAKVREWARRMRKGPCAGSNGYKLRLIKGAAKKTAPEIPLTPREVNRTDDGKAIVPPVLEYDLGVHELKKTVAAYLGVDTPGPGYVNFPYDFDPAHVDELAAERLVDGEWVRSGKNETFDDLVYAEAVRRMLRPERPQIRWDDAPPPWARPVEIADDDEDDDIDDAELAATPPPPAKKLSANDRMARLNRR